MTQTLGSYKKHVRECLQKVSETLPGVAAGDFSKRLKIPKEEDEFTELYLSINYMIEDLQEKQNERNLAKEKLEESEERYRLLVETMNDGFGIQDENGVIIYVNDRFCEMVGYTREELIGLPAIDLLDEKNKNIVLEQTAKREKKAGEEYEIAWIHKNGSVVHTIISPQALYNANNQNIGSFAVITDITERKKVEESLWVSTQQWQSTFDAITDAICILDNERKIVQCNNATTKLIGEPAKFILGHYCCKLLHNKSKLFKGCPFRRMQKTLKRENVVLSMRDKWFNVTVDPIFGKEGKLMGAVHIMTDVTEQKVAEDALRESEGRFRHFFENEPEYCYMVSPEGNILDVNKSALKALGYKKEELVGKLLRCIYAPESLKKMEILFDKWKRTGKLRNEELLIITNKGEKRTVLLSADIFKGKDGQVIHSISVQRDITELKQTEKSLQELTKKLAIMFESVSEGIAFTDLDGNILKLNDAAAHMYGVYDKKELIGRSAFDFISDKDRPKALENMRRTVEDGQSGEVEYMLLKKDGTEYTAGFNATLLKDNNMNPVGVVAIIRDVTERKKTEKEMKKRLMRYNVEDGNLYLVKEPSLGMSIEIIKDLLRVGYPVIIISRTPERELKEEIEQPFNHLWLSENGNENSVPPRIKDLESLFNDKYRGDVILIERIDYLISKNDFKKTLAFVQHLREIAYLNDNIIILSIDSSALDTKELRQLEKECLEIERQYGKRVPEYLLEILQFVNDQSLFGTKPTYSMIGKELCMSKPTVRKRIRQLANAGYIIDMVKGRSKVVELTERGRDLVLK